MTMETRRQEQDIRVYRCDGMSENSRCVRETASFITEGVVTVFLDAAWLSLHMGLVGEKHFCSWDHMAEWVQHEHTEALAAQLRHAARIRQQREDAEAVDTRARLAIQKQSADILGEV